ncbi:MAG: M23 family metallopeptidase [Corynebacteriales bacterium]|nr:M23 family metallopeptidase [Mycobacteriales bacterium]
MSEESPSGPQNGGGAGGGGQSRADARKAAKAGREPGAGAGRRGASGTGGNPAAKGGNKAKGAAAGGAGGAGAAKNAAGAGAAAKGAAGAAKGGRPDGAAIGTGIDAAKKGLGKHPVGKKLGDSGLNTAGGAAKAVVGAKTGNPQLALEGAKELKEAAPRFVAEQAKKKVKQGLAAVLGVFLLFTLCVAYVGGGGLGNAFSTGANAPGASGGDPCGGGGTSSTANQSSNNSSEPADPALVQVKQTESNLAPFGSWDKEQVNNAQIIYDVGKQLGVPERGIVIALTTSIGEQRLRHKPDEPNQTYAAIGMFQQRPQSGWGRWEYIKNRWYAATNYYRGPRYAVEAVLGIKPGNTYELDISGGPNPDQWKEGNTGKQVSWNNSPNTGGGKGLMGIKDWDGKTITQIIELVQVADAEKGYWVKQEADAKALYEHLSGSPASDNGSGNTATQPRVCDSTPGEERFCYDNKTVMIGTPKIVNGWTTPSYGKITSDYGVTDNAHDKPHTGTDIANAECTQVQAVADGKVVEVKCNVTLNGKKLPDKECDVQRGDEVLRNGIGGYGWTLVIEHAGNIKTRYGHLVRKPIVQEGQDVKVGELIGFMGSTGRSTGPHLHFEVHDPNLTSGKEFLKKHDIEIPATVPQPEGGGNYQDCPFGEGKKGGPITAATGKVCAYVYKTFPFKAEGGANCNRGGSADHGTGMACDFMTNHKAKQSTGAELDLGNRTATWAMQNAKEFGIEYIIWQQRIWNTREAAKPLNEWRKMEDRGGATQNHYDHVHISMCANTGNPPFETCADNGA